MRAYVITELTIADEGIGFKTHGVVSSKKKAIATCEELLTEDGVEVTWDEQAKHTGIATSGDRAMHYDMFFVD